MSVFNVNGKTYEFDDPSGNSDDWTVVKQESYKLSKRETVLKKFNEEFQFDVEDYDQLTRVCSRSKVFTNWLINANLAYSEEAQLPLFVKDVIEPQHFRKLQSTLSKINVIYSEQSLKKKKLAEQFKNDLKVIEQEEIDLADKLKKQDKLLHILAMNSTYLPFSIQLKIEKYVPKDEEKSQESREVFGRECLINYKRMLCKVVIDNPGIDIVELINTNMLK